MVAAACFASAPFSSSPVPFPLSPQRRFDKGDGEETGMETHRPEMAAGGSVPAAVAMAQPAAAVAAAGAARAAPSTPAGLSSLHPGDARHLISEIRRSSGRCGGNEGELRLPKAQFSSPLARKGQEAYKNGTTGQDSEGPKAERWASAGSRAQNGQSDQEVEDALDAEPALSKVKRKLYPAERLVPSPSSPAGSVVLPPSLHKDQTAGGAHGTEPQGGIPELPRPSGSRAPADKNQSLSAGNHQTEPAKRGPKRASRSGKRARKPEHQTDQDGNDTERSRGGPVATASSNSREQNGTRARKRSRKNIQDKPDGDRRNKARGQPGPALAGPSNVAAGHCDDQLTIDEAGVCGSSRAATEQPDRQTDDSAATEFTQNLIEALFPTVPVVFDVGAIRGRVWSPLNGKGEFDPHWTTYPLDPSLPLVPGEGSCSPADLDQPDSALPSTIHAWALQEAREGTLFASTVARVRATAAAVESGAFDAVVDDPPPVPPDLLARLVSRPFRFPRTGTNPFLGAAIAAAAPHAKDDDDVNGNDDGSDGGNDDDDLLVQPSWPPAPPAEGVEVPPALPHTICDAIQFDRGGGDDKTVAASNQYKQSIAASRAEAPWDPPSWKGKGVDRDMGSAARVARQNGLGSGEDAHENDDEAPTCDTDGTLQSITEAMRLACTGPAVLPSARYYQSCRVTDSQMNTERNNNGQATASFAGGLSYTPIDHLGVINNIPNLNSISEEINEPREGDQPNNARDDTAPAAGTGHNRDLGMEVVDNPRGLTFSNRHNDKDEDDKYGDELDAELAPPKRPATDVSTSVVAQYLTEMTPAANPAANSAIASSSTSSSQPSSAAGLVPPLVAAPEQIFDLDGLGDDNAVGQALGLTRAEMDAILSGGPASRPISFDQGIN
ncbi:hypothetical protein MYCTH_2128478 [Thermothelomyces thermophilus ATCC 42464]|uniref:Uncharacterized protein n=1 Tax=Thermothelomyces thermophilus (strain ATCC 42464 / BCRC 31852 / DSM 1799) TaxID=573729 RepID=G2QGK9_THET4|nr:uncharacterized protein MYCTH_2128478 [Thermothelomyces thermophilus ATCC 42464]AEO59419.1 hypothetical protein MYCTH_2128478 [Thermothelomyces thermophilus ATCC 42464]